MNSIYDLIQIIATSGSKGQELMIDSFTIGYMFGQKKITSQDQVQKFVKQLKEMKNEIDQGLKFPSVRDEFLIQKLDNLQIPQKKEKNDDVQALKKQRKTEPKSSGQNKQKKLAQTTPIVQCDNKDQNDFQQIIQEEGEGEKQQTQQNTKKSSNQQLKKTSEGVQTRHQAAQQKADQQKNE